METFSKLSGSWLVFVYHCFDGIVISGFLMGLQRPGQVVYWLQQVLGIEAITKEVLSRRTEQYVRWVQAYARNRKIPLEWAEKDVRKEMTCSPTFAGSSAAISSVCTSSSRLWSRAGPCPTGSPTGSAPLWRTGRLPDPAPPPRATATTISICAMKCSGR